MIYLTTSTIYSYRLAQDTCKKRKLSRYNSNFAEEIDRNGLMKLVIEGQMECRRRETQKGHIDILKVNGSANIKRVMQDRDE